MSGAVVILRQNRLIRRLRELGATSPADAVAWEQVSRRYGFIARSLVRHGAIVRTGETFYLDEPVADAWIRRRNRTIWITTGVLLIVFGIVLALSGGS